MKRLDNKMTDIQVAYIGGGSRGWAWNIMADFALEEQLSGTIRLYDIDQKASEANEIIGNKMNALEGAKSDWQYTVATSLEEALTGADFVIISILPGTFEEMYSDVHEPEKYGIYQAVGDTVGPGGLVRAMRTIPMFVEIAEAVKAYAPKSWVINYTNPMTVCIRTLYKVFPEIKAFGCCHEVFGTQKLLTQALADIKGIEGVDRREIDVNVIGINHFTWVDRASYKDIDLFPIYQAFVEKYHETGFTEDSDTNWMNSSFKSAQRVKFDLFKRYGVIAAAGDRHLAEFMPPYYLKNPETVKSWMFGLTTVDYRMKDLEERREKSRKLVEGEQELELVPSGEEGIELIKALCGLGEFKSNVNIPNVGQISNLPKGAVVETNAMFTYDAIVPMMAGEIPAPIQTMVLRHVNNQEMTVEAAMTQDKELAFKVFMNDPLVTVGLGDGRVLFDTMLDNTKKYLPNWQLS